MHIGDNVVKFPFIDKKNYLSKPDKKVSRNMSEEIKRKMIEGLNILQTVGGNKNCFREHQYKRAQVTRKLYHMVIFPTSKNLITQNIIQNFPVTVEDIEIMEKYLSRYVYLKGKNKEKNSKTVCGRFYLNTKRTD